MRELNQYFETLDLGFKCLGYHRRMEEDQEDEAIARPIQERTKKDLDLQSEECICFYITADPATTEDATDVLSHPDGYVTTYNGSLYLFWPIEDTIPYSELLRIMNKIESSQNSTLLSATSSIYALMRTSDYTDDKVQILGELFSGTEVTQAHEREWFKISFTAQLGYIRNCND